MTNVWAYRTQNLGATFAVAGEWNQVMVFNTLPDLLDEFKKANFSKGQVRKLGIVAHGDVPGKVQMQPVDLTVSTAGSFGKDFDALRDYLWINARIIFYSCIAAAKQEGSALLNELSGKYFPGRHVIGFERYGTADDGKQPAGYVRCSNPSPDGKPHPEYYCDPTATLKPVTDHRRQTEQILSEYAIYAKWSFSGRIIKIPYDEIIRQIYSVPQVICGPEAVMQALKDPAKLAKVEYIAINTKNHPSNKLVQIYAIAQERGFPWSTLLIPKRMREFSEEEVKLVREQKGQLRRHEEIVAVCEKKLTMKYKCAWSSCPSHLHVQDYCKQGVEHIPNGPLV